MLSFVCSPSCLPIALLNMFSLAATVWCPYFWWIFRSSFSVYSTFFNTSRVHLCIRKTFSSVNCFSLPLYEIVAFLRGTSNQFKIISCMEIIPGMSALSMRKITLMVSFKSLNGTSINAEQIPSSFPQIPSTFLSSLLLIAGLIPNVS